MADEIRNEALIILVQHGRAQAHNSKLWTEWASPLPTFKAEPRELLDTLKQMRDQGFDYVWLADASYEPLKTSFRLYLRKLIWDKSRFTIFKAARPTFSRIFYEEKLTADYDDHDKFGGLRYVQIDAAIDDIEPMQYDKTCGGQDIDYLEHPAAKLSFPYSVFHLTSHEPATVTHPSFDAARRLYPSIEMHWSEESILESHKQLAAKSGSDMFFVFDGDVVITKPLGIESFKPWDEEYVHIWYVENQVNGLVYGHGGPKAFNRKSFINLTEDSTVDVTTSSNERKLMVHPNSVGYHRFNWSEESSWRTAFREAAKLTWQIQDSGGTGDVANEAAERLLVWMNPELINPDAPFGDECVDGACEGNAWALVADKQERVLLNNWDWLHEQFERYQEELNATLDDDFDDEEDEEGDEDPAADFEDKP